MLFRDVDDDLDDDDEEDDEDDITEDESIDDDNSGFDNDAGSRLGNIYCKQNYITLTFHL